MTRIKDFSAFLNERELPDKQGKIIVILGQPGSGKGTISKQLAENNDVVHISTGDLIRESNDRELKSVVGKGDFIPDRIMSRMLRKKLRETDLSKDIIIDGFPRTMKQTLILDRILGKLGVGLNHCIYLDVSEDIAKKRIMRRAEKENRPEDKKEKTIEKRFKDFKEKTAPIVDKYEKSRRLVKIDGSKKIRDVYKEVAKVLGLKVPVQKKGQ